MLLDDVLTYSSSPERQKYLQYVSLREKLDLTKEQLAHFDVGDLLERKSSILSDKQRLDELDQMKESLSKQYEDLQDRLSHANKYLSFSEKDYEFWKEVLYRTNKFYLDDLSRMLTDCYQTIYQDSTKSIQLVPEEYRNKQIIKIKFNVIIDGNTYVEDFGSQAGSIKTILGLIMSIYYILLMKLPRVIFIDETLASLDVDILHRTLDVLKKFTDKFGFCYFCVTHHGKYLQEYIDKAYSIDDFGVYHEIQPEEAR